MRLVLIEWLDSHGSESRWKFATDISRVPLICRSIGWLLYDDEQCKVIVPHLTQDDHPTADQQAWGEMTIPSRAILKMVDLAVVEETQPA